MTESSRLQEIRRLHRLERTLLSTLKDDRKASFDELGFRTKLSSASVSRAALWLSSKGLAKIEEEKRTLLRLGSEGKTFSERGLPERVLVEAVLRTGGKIALDKVFEVSKISKEEANIALGWARRKGWLQFMREGEKPFLVVNEEPAKGSDEKLIDLLSKRPIAIDELDPKLIEGLTIL